MSNGRSAKPTWGRPATPKPCAAGATLSTGSGAQRKERVERSRWTGCGGIRTRGAPRMCQRLSPRPASPSVTSWESLGQLARRCSSSMLSSARKRESVCPALHCAAYSDVTIRGLQSLLFPEASQGGNGGHSTSHPSAIETKVSNGGASVRSRIHHLGVYMRPSFIRL